MSKHKDDGWTREFRLICIYDEDGRESVRVFRRLEAAQDAWSDLDAQRYRVFHHPELSDEDQARYLPPLPVAIWMRKVGPWERMHPGTGLDDPSLSEWPGR